MKSTETRYDSITAYSTDQMQRRTRARVHSLMLA